MEHYLDQMKAEISPKTQSGDAVDKTVSMLQSLVDDCPTPTAEDFKKMAGLQMALMNALGVNILSSMTGSRKIDRGLLQLAFKAFELSLKATSIGASIKLED